MVLDDFVTVEWLEITGGGGSADGIRTNLLSAGAGSLVTLRNNLIHNVPGDGIALYDADGRVDVYDNISYGNNTGLYIDPGSLAAGSRIRILNNTFYGNGGGIFKAGGASAATVLLRNNISVFNNPGPDYICDPVDSVDPASSNNLDEDNSGGTGAGTHNPAGGRVTSTVAGPGLRERGGGDLHIQPGSTARDVGADLSGVFTSDIDASLRQAPWDIGADEIVGTALYRSVGITATALASGAGNALTISGSTATFASPLPNNIGVGDAIQYDSDNNGSIDALAFIHGRTNSQAYTVKNKSGAAPIPTGTPDTDWAVYRAYTSLANWEAQNENGNISNAPVALRDFDTSTNLVSSNTTMNVACYGDGADTTPVTVVRLDDGSRQLHPHLHAVPASEVGTSQRHSGTWNATTAYRLQAAPPINSGTLWIQTNYVRVDGLQVWQTNDNDYTAAIYMNGAVGVSSYEISNNIVRGVGGAPSKPGRIGINNFDAGAAGSVAKIWNNLVYDFNGGQPDVAGILLDDADFTHYVYNNTVVDGGQGIAQYNGTVVAKNNLAYNNIDNYNGAFDAASTYNLSGPGADAQIPATNARNGVTVTFVNAALDDFHLAGGDVGALNQGTNLSADSNLAILLDIDHQSRVPAWDIGADDASGTTAVKLMAFEARPARLRVSLKWQTGSELDNLGFHVYRGPSADGPWTRLTTSLIPGLGSSAVGRGVLLPRRWPHERRALLLSPRGRGRVVEDDLARARLGGAVGGELPRTSGGGRRRARAEEERVLVLPGLGALGVRLLGGRRRDDGVLALHAPRRPRGGVARRRRARRALGDARAADGRASTRCTSPRARCACSSPGFDFPQDEQAAALPIRRALADAVVGRRVQLGGVRALELVSFKGLRALGGSARPRCRWARTAPCARRGDAPARPPRLLPEERARDARCRACSRARQKSAVVEIAPLRFEAQRQQLVLAKRVLVRLLFTGREAGESGRGSLGRAPRAGTPVSGEILARLHTHQRGACTRVSFERAVPGREREASRRRSCVSSGRASRWASTSSPRRDAFGPGSRLYFYAERAAASTDFSGEVAYELVRWRGRRRDAASVRGARLERPRHGVVRLALLRDEPVLPAGAARGDGPVAVGGARLGGDAGEDASRSRVSRHPATRGAGRVPAGGVRVRPGGRPPRERLASTARSWARRSLRASSPTAMSLEPAARRCCARGRTSSRSRTWPTPASRRSCSSTASASPTRSAGSLTSGLFEGTWAESGTAAVSGLSGPAALVDVSAARRGRVAARGYQASGGSVRFHAEAGHRYLVASADGAARAARGGTRRRRRCARPRTRPTTC